MTTSTMLSNIHTCTVRLRHVFTVKKIHVHDISTPDCADSFALLFFVLIGNDAMGVSVFGVL